MWMRDNIGHCLLEGTRDRVEYANRTKRNREARRWSRAENAYATMSYLPLVQHVTPII